MDKPTEEIAMDDFVNIPTDLIPRGKDNTMTKTFNQNDTNNTERSESSTGNLDTQWDINIDDSTTEINTNIHEQITENQISQNLDIGKIDENEAINNGIKVPVSSKQIYNNR